MPIQNFAGWTATGAVFMGLSRWLWRSDPPAISPGFPLAVYVLNLAFAIVLSAAGDVWVPIVVALVAAVGALALRLRGIPRRRWRPAV
jgi:putative membrane protein